jgi:hypothetical protein
VHVKPPEELSTRYAQNRKNGKPNNSNVFAGNKTKGPKQDSQNRLGSPMTEEEEPTF